MPIQLDLTPIDRIAEAQARATEARVDLICAVSAARAEGRSWQDIGDALGITKQAAWEQWKHLEHPAPLT